VQRLAANAAALPDIRVFIVRTDAARIAPSMHDEEAVMEGGGDMSWTAIDTEHPGGAAGQADEVGQRGALQEIDHPWRKVRGSRAQPDQNDGAIPGAVRPSLAKLANSGGIPRFALTPSKGMEENEPVREFQIGESSGAEGELRGSGGVDSSGL
jgi:hypothetical protein